VGEPIPFHPAKSGAANTERLRNAPADHAEALLSAYELLQLLHDRGVLNLLRGLVDAGDDVIETIAKAVDTPESIRALRNVILLSKVFSNIPPETVSTLVETVRAGAEREKAHRAPGLLRLLWRLRNDDSRHAAAVGLDLLEGLGKGLWSSGFRAELERAR
jgi:uncharacterized protein YjgD (DUF1641 family)